MLQGVEKTSEGESPLFIWVTFKVVWQDGVPKIEIIETLENDTVIIPSFSLDSLVDLKQYDIYTYMDSPLYFSINEGKAVFSPEYSENSKFSGYVYYGGQPEKGNVLVYLLPNDKPSPPPVTLAGTVDNNVEVMDFLSFMLGKDIPANPRFWYQKFYKNGFSLESVMSKNMYLGVNQNGEAILSNKPTEFRVNESTIRPPSTAGEVCTQSNLT